jgi:hypothetical protein
VDVINDEFSQKTLKQANANKVYNFIKSYGLLLLIFIVLVVLLSILLFFIFHNLNHSNTISKKINKSIITPTLQVIPANFDHTSTQYISIGENVGNNINDNGVIYFSTEGGVIGYNQKTGYIVDQISNAQGLSGQPSGSLAMIGDSLYIGTQNGFSIYNVKTKAIQRVTTDQGLVNGANIILSADPDETTLWIGSFKGFSSYNIQTGQITNYNSQIGIQEFETHALLVTSNFVLVSVNTTNNGNTSISDALYLLNKTSGIWQNVSLNGITSTDTVGFSKIIDSNNKIVIESDSKKLWETDASSLGTDTTWNLLTNPSADITSQLKGYNIGIPTFKDTPVFIGRPNIINYLFGSINHDAILEGDNHILEYNPYYDSFTDLTNNPNFNSEDGIINAFQPINNTKNIFIMTQTDGIGTPITHIWILDYMGFKLQDITNTFTS